MFYLIKKSRLSIFNFYNIIKKYIRILLKNSNIRIITCLLKPLLVLALTLSIIILSVKFTVMFKPLYYYDINKFNIEESSNLSEKEIKSNYNYLIDYISNNKSYDFKLPSLPSSSEGIIHFKEVKGLFEKLDYILYFSLIICFTGVILEVKRKHFYFLKWTSINLFLLPFILSIPLMINFDKSFTYFHKIFFNNDYWLLSSKTDPIINMLPQNFFCHCAILILLLIFIWSSFLLLTYKKISLNKKN